MLQYYRDILGFLCRKVQTPNNGEIKGKGNCVALVISHTYSSLKQKETVYLVLQTKGKEKFLRLPHRSKWLILCLHCFFNIVDHLHSIPYPYLHTKSYLPTYPYIPKSYIPPDWGKNSSPGHRVICTVYSVVDQAF